MDNEIAEILAVFTASANDPVNIGRATDTSRVSSSERAFILKGLPVFHYNLLMAKYACDESAKFRLGKEWLFIAIGLAKQRKYSKSLDIVSVAKVTLKELMSPKRWTNERRNIELGRSGKNRSSSKLSRYNELLTYLIECEAEAFDYLRRGMSGK
jgi:hypothetical protein